MMRPCFIGCLVVLIVIPENARSFFYIPVLDIIEPTGNLTCYLNSTESTITDFKLCAIRVYTTQINMDESYDVNVQNGIWFTNIFRRLITTRNCSDFSNTSDVGISICDAMPYETVDNMVLCICATDNCNRNLETCEVSVRTNSDDIVLPRSLPALVVPVECSQTSQTSDACCEHTSINSELCDIYVKNHSVLCTIAIDGIQMTQKALIEENYEAFLDGKLHELKPVVHANPTNLMEETENYVYYAYDRDTIRTVQECACMQSSFCNYNISTCAPNVIQTERTTSTQSTLITLADFTSQSTSITPILYLTTESTVNVAMTIDYTTSTNSVKVNNSITDFLTATTIATDFTTEIISTSSESTTTIATEFTTRTIPVTTQSTPIVVVHLTTAASPVSTKLTATIATDFTTENIQTTTKLVPTTTATTTVITTQVTTDTFIAIESTITASSMTINTNIDNINRSRIEIVDPVTITVDLSNGTITGIIVGITLAIVLCISMICYQCIRSGKLRGPCGDRSGDYRT